MPGPRIRWILGLAALILSGGLAGYWILETRLADTPIGSLEIEPFLEQHWARPLAAIGARAGGVETPALDPEACGSCHAQQLADWQGSRHSQAMAAGIRWQFHVYDQAASNQCMECHAPLAEQKALVAIDRAWSNRPAGPLPDYLPADLHLKGISCASCHVRSAGVFGPPSRVGLTGAEAGLPHGGFTPHPAYEDSRFCAGCHQFPDDGPRLNGKLRQDTYNEWLESGYAEQGVTCQQCHMPDRRHRWRGISDPETLAAALTAELIETADAEGRPQVHLTLTNSGAGHRLPTYLVPRIDIEAVWLDAEGRELGTLIHHVLQWRASLDLSVESFDHRLAPGEVRVLTAALQRPLEAADLRMTINVAPKEHYERVYLDMLRQADRMTPEVLRLLRQAIDEATASRFVLIEEKMAAAEPIRWRFGP